MNRLARRRDANLLPRGLDSSSQLHQFILSCCMLFTIHCGHRPPHIRREGPTINPVLFERDDPSDLVDVTVARRHSSEREREGAKIRKAKYLTQLFTKWSIFVCNCEAVTCYLFYNGRVARGPDPTKKITHVPETFRAEQSRGAICFASPWITLLPNRKGNIKSYHSPVHRNESVTTVLRGIWYLRVAIIQVRGDKWQFRFMQS